MIDLLKPFKEKVKNDFVKFAKEKIEVAKEQFIAMAKALDLDNNGVKDPAQVGQDLAKAAAACKIIQGGVVLLSEAGRDLLALVMAYYIHFGKQNPVDKVAALEQKPDIA